MDSILAVLLSVQDPNDKTCQKLQLRKKLSETLNGFDQTPVAGGICYSSSGLPIVTALNHSILIHQNTALACRLAVTVALCQNWQGVLIDGPNLEQALRIEAAKQGLSVHLKATPRRSG